MRSLAAELDRADVGLRGERPWDMLLHDPRVEGRVRRAGLTALGDAYVEGWWDCQAPDQLFDRLLRADLPRLFRWTMPAISRCLYERLVNVQTRRRARTHVRSHYNLGADLFTAMLDSRMVYSCAYWRGVTDLESAQLAKLDLVCRKLALREGMRLLDIGCGWGGLCRHAAERYGCRVVGITLSENQRAIARQRCAGLPVEIELADYRELGTRIGAPFDRVASLGMFEHVGQKNHRAFMLACRRVLAPDGLALVHTFATQRSWPNLSDTEQCWVERRIFPGFVTPSLAQIGRAADGLFVLEDLENFGADYDPTLMAWHANFARAYPSLRERYPPPFDRLWSYYLLLCAGAFRSRKYQLWHLVLSPRGMAGGYARPGFPPP